MSQSHDWIEARRTCGRVEAENRIDLGSWWQEIMRMEKAFDAAVKIQNLYRLFLKIRTQNSCIIVPMQEHDVQGTANTD